MQAAWAKYRLDFRFLARTSRESMRVKDTYFIKLTDNNGRTAYGECALFRGLSADDMPDYEVQLGHYCRHLEQVSSCPYSSIRFGIETAMANLGHNAGDAWHSGNIRIPINGLIWIGDKQEMSRRIDEKLAAGFNVLKLKIGSIGFDDELDLLRMIRNRYSCDTLELRLDANGAFLPDDALKKLNRLSLFGIHSIEQPVRAGQHELMHRLCRTSPIPIALDEELIGGDPSILASISPAYIILKPALCGGLSGAEAWAEAAERLGIGYWFTSALESNIGLDAIAGLATKRGIGIPQGLGTGQLYHNNIEGPIFLHGSSLCYNPDKQWQIPQLDWHTTLS